MKSSFAALLLLFLGVSAALGQIGTRTLPPVGETSFAHWGHSLAMNSLYVVAGDPAVDGGTGAVRVIDFKSGAVLKTINGSLPGAAFGTAVALRGSELVVGSPNASGGVGLVTFIDIPTGKTLGVIDPTVPSFGPNVSGAFGASIACDGDLIAVGAPQAANSGVARGLVAAVRRKIGAKGDGASIYALLPSDPQDNASFGHAVAVYGTSVAVGAPNFDQPGLADSGKVYLYKGLPGTSNTAITETLAEWTGATAVGVAYGHAVALSSSHLIASAPYVTASQGAVWFTNHLYPARPSEVVNGLAAGELFGYSLAAGESLVAIGVPGYSPGGALISPGQVRVYQEPSDVTPFILSLKGILERPFLVTNSLTGQTVAVVGNQVLGGSPGISECITAGFALSSFDSNHPIRVEASTGEGLPSGFAPTMTGFTQAAVSGLGPYQSRTLSAVNTSYKPTPSAAPVKGQAFLMPYLGVLAYKAPGSLQVTPTALTGNTGNYYGYSTVPNQFRAFAASTITESLLVERYLPLGTGEMKSFGAARHGRAPVLGADLFAFPCVFQTKSGGPTVTAATDSAITVFAANGPAIRVFQEGVDVFTPTGDVFGQATGRLALESRNLVFTSPLQGAPALIDTVLASYDMETSTFATVTREGDTAPGATPATAQFSTFLGETSDGFGPNRATLFRATLRGAGITAATNEGLWVHDTTLSPTPMLVLQKGIPITALKGTPKISRILRYGMDVNGAILVLATLSGGGTTAANNLVLLEYRLPLFDVTILLQKGTSAPGTNGALVKDIPFLDVRRSGHWAATVTLARSPGRADATNDLAVYTNQTSAANDPVLALRKGARFSRPGAEILKSILLSATVTDGRSGALATGMSHVVDTDRSAAAILTFTDNVQSVATINP